MSDMYYIVESAKSFEQASADLRTAVDNNGFGILHVHDLGAKLREKGQQFTGECRIFEVCNPAQAARVLATDMRLNMALPCRISVYIRDGKTCIGMIRPQSILSALSPDPALTEVAREVEEKTVKMIDEAR